jgi:hypothetical protein
VSFPFRHSLQSRLRAQQARPLTNPRQFNRSFDRITGPCTVSDEPIYTQPAGIIERMQVQIIARRPDQGLCNRYCRLLTAGALGWGLPIVSYTTAYRLLIAAAAKKMPTLPVVQVPVAAKPLKTPF